MRWRGREIRLGAGRFEALIDSTIFAGRVQETQQAALGGQAMSAGKVSLQSLESFFPFEGNCLFLPLFASFHPQLRDACGTLGGVGCSHIPESSLPDQAFILTKRTE